MDYLDFWELRQPPFEADSNPVFFYESEVHGEALARMMYLVSDKAMGLGALTGEIGSGKSMILRVLQTRIRRDLYRVASLVTSNYEFENILREIVIQLEPEAEASGSAGRYEISKRFEKALQAQVLDHGRHLLVLLDEAQFLSLETLDQLKCLTNLNRPERPALSIIFVGQPELQEKLKALPQVYQRLGMIYHLGRLRHPEVPAYVEHRVTVAGIENRRVFRDDVYDPLFEFSEGCPRQINRVCKLAVDRACLLKKDCVDGDMIRLIVGDITTHFG